MLMTYEDFLERVEMLGFMSLSPLLPGLPSLSGETPENLWHTGLDTDPWRWKDRAAEEKCLAYGCILGGHKGFVSQRMYPVFYAAFYPLLSMPERWEMGMIKQRIWQVWQLCEERGTLNISQIRKSLGVSHKHGASAVDNAIQQLQKEYYITMDGNDRKISAKGQFYGWPINRYRRVLDWVPAGWLENSMDFTVEEAREMILEEGLANADGVTSRDLAKKLFGT